MVRGNKSRVEAFPPYLISICQHWAMKNPHLLCLLLTQTQSVVAAWGSTMGLPVPFFLLRSARCFSSGTREHSPSRLSLGGGSAWVSCVSGGRVWGARLCSVVPSSKSRCDGQKPIHRKFHLNTRKKSIVRMTADWNRVPTEIVGSPSLQKFRNCLDAILCHVLWGDTALAGRLAHCGPFQTEPFCETPREEGRRRWNHPRRNPGTKLRFQPLRRP